MTQVHQKRFAPAFIGEGYGTMRRRLFESARKHIEQAIEHSYFCEAIAICESIIADRLESRLSFLRKENVKFGTLGRLIKALTALEDNCEVLELLPKIDQWRERRNSALHEMVKVTDGTQNLTWNERMTTLRQVACDGYLLVCKIYWCVADLNPNHLDRVLPRPEVVKERYSCK